MSIVEAFNAWESHPTYRTQAQLLEAMRAYSVRLDHAGYEQTWHEDLEVTCHDEIVYLLEMMGGARGLIAA